MTVSAVPQSTNDIENDWRFAALVARTWSEPDLATRYTKDPRAVLATFGLHLDVLAMPPALPSGGDLFIEDFNDISPIAVPTGFCNVGAVA